MFPDGTHCYRCMQARSPSQDVGRALRRGARGARGCYAMRPICNDCLPRARDRERCAGGVDGEGRVEGGRVQGKCKYSVYVRHGTRGHARGQQWHEGETSGLCRADGGALQGGQRRCLGRRSTASLVSAHRAWKSTNPSAQVVGCDATGIDGHHRIGSTQANLNCRSER